MVEELPVVLGSVEDSGRGKEEEVMVSEMIVMVEQR